MELSTRYNLCQLFHINRFDVDNVKRLISYLNRYPLIAAYSTVYLMMPQINAEIVGRQEGVLIRIDRNRVYMVSMRVRVHSSGACLNNQLHLFQFGKN